VRIANCSGFFGDRLSAAREMVEGGPIDVLSGDWLAELTMVILAKSRARGGQGWASTFLTQMEQVLATCVKRGIKVVSNAGGLDPAGCAAAVRELASRLGVRARVAYVEGDDLLPRMSELSAAGHDLANTDTGEKLAEAGIEPLTANAYLGGWGIATALAEGADVVVTGRVTDAALVEGPAAWWWGWERGDWDRLAGAVVAGHVIECGAQATGGNYSFFTEVPGLEHAGFPLAEVDRDGTAVITKHPGTGGAVSVETVTAQLLYEIGTPAYANPDVVARFDTISLASVGPDRVRISDVRGEPAPTAAKVALNYLGGYRNSVTFVLTGLDTEAKADLVLRTLWSHVPGGPSSFASVDVKLSRPPPDDPATNEDALRYLTVTVMDPDEARVGRAFSNLAVEMALASYPGMFGGGGGGPGGASAFGVYWPTTLPAELVEEVVVTDDGRRLSVCGPPVPERREAVRLPAPSPVPGPAPAGPTVRTQLGRVVGARSGDKGGNANLGVWARTDDAYAWLNGFLTAGRLRVLLPECGALGVERYELANLRALNFVIAGLLGRGVAASTRTDPQAKGLGEYLRAKVVEIPAALLA